MSSILTLREIESGQDGIRAVSVTKDNLPLITEDPTALMDDPPTERGAPTPAHQRTLCDDE